MDKITFAQLLSDKLEEEARSQRWLAERMHISRSTVNRWCSGDRMPTSLDQVKAIARLLRCTPDEKATLFRASGFAYFDVDPTLTATPHSDPPTNEPRNHFGLGAALRGWLNDFLRLDEASDHEKSSWAGMALYLLGTLPQRIAPQSIVATCVALLLWAVATWLAAPALVWPLPPAVRLTAFAMLGSASLVVPLLLSFVTRPDGYDRFDLDSRKRRFTLWLLSYIGAVVGFGAFLLLILLFVLGWHYFALPALPTLVRMLLLLIPLFFGYVAARRIPFDRLKMYGPIPQLHPADWMAGISFTLLGPLVATSLYLFYDLFSNRMTGRLAYLIALAVLAVAVARSEKAAPAEPDQEAV